jgi:hypothetical protein
MPSSRVSSTTTMPSFNSDRIDTIRPRPAEVDPTITPSSRDYVQQRDEHCTTSANANGPNKLGPIAQKTTLRAA